jgi:hypothetical protein
MDEFTTGAENVTMIVLTWVAVGVAAMKMTCDIAPSA